MTGKLNAACRRVDADVSTTWDRGIMLGVKINRDESGNYVGTKGMNTTKLEWKMRRPGPLPSLYR